MIRSRFVLLSALLACPRLAAQTPTPYAPAVVSAEDYGRAERQLGQYTAPLVVGAAVNPQWLSDGRFWYCSTGEAGTRFVLPARARTEPLFDPARLSAAPSQASGPPSPRRPSPAP